VFALIILLLFTACSSGEEAQRGQSPKEEIMIKQPELAGTWYPGTESELRRMIDGFMERANPPEIDGRIVGIISPHAGLAHSGLTAAHGFKPFMLDSDTYSGATVILIGLNHRNPGFGGISVWAKGAWASPLGTTHIDEALADSILVALGDFGDFHQGVYRQENSLETQLPFVQYAFPKDVKIVPILFGTQSVQASMMLAEVLSQYSSRDDIVIVASTDLSHFHDVESAKVLDEKFIDAVMNWSADSVISRLQSGRAEACGFGTVLTLMLSAEAFGADSVVNMHYSTSADGPIGDPSNVVGYFSAAFIDTKPDGKTKNADNTAPEEEYTLTDEQKIYLLKLARTTIEKFVIAGEAYQPEPPDDPKLAGDGAVFVTLTRDGQLRGCIGNMAPQGPLYLAVRDMAISSAVHDRRFRPVTEDELAHIDIEISVLSPMRLIDDWRNIEVGRHGVWLRRGQSSGVFLPQVGRDTGWSLERFLEELSSQKAGLRRDIYKDPKTQLYVFTVLDFEEHDFDLR